MNIAMIDGSPKFKKSASGELLRELKTCFGEGTSFEDLPFHTPRISEEVIHRLNEFDALVFAYPLYVDGIPSHLLENLERIQQVGLANKNIAVYGVVNSGFYEGKQNANAIAVLQNWCRRTGLFWGMGVGIGGGGALASMGSVPLGKGPKKSIGLAFSSLAKNVENKSGGDNIYVSLDFPRFLYKLAAQMGWRQMIKSNGGKVKDLNYRY